MGAHRSRVFSPAPHVTAAAMGSRTATPQAITASARGMTAGLRTEKSTAVPITPKRTGCATFVQNTATSCSVSCAYSALGAALYQRGARSAAQSLVPTIAITSDAMAPAPV